MLGRNDIGEWFKNGIQVFRVDTGTIVPNPYSGPNPRIALHRRPVDENLDCASRWAIAKRIADQIADDLVDLVRINLYFRARLLIKFSQ